MEQLPDAGMVPPERLSELPPLAMVTVPPQELDEGVAEVFFRLLEGYVSVKAVPVIAAVLEFIRVMVMFEAPDTGMVLGLKTFVAVGEVTAVSISETAVPVPALVVEIFPVLFV